LRKPQFGILKANCDANFEQDGTGNYNLWQIQSGDGGSNLESEGVQHTIWNK
jgi:hypothetical protein